MNWNTEPERGSLPRRLTVTSHHLFTKVIPDLWSLGLPLGGQLKCRKVRERWMPFLSGLTDPSHISCSAKAYREKREYLATLFDQTRKSIPFLSAASLIPVFKTRYSYTLPQGFRV